MDMSRSTLGRVFRLALPAMLENFLSTLVNIVDVAMVGSLGAVATAAAALNSQPLWLSMGCSVLAAGSASVLVARCWGAHDERLASVYSRAAIVLSFVLGGALTSAAWLSADVYCGWMRAAPEVALDAAAYMRTVGTAMIPFVLTRTLAGVIQGAGDTLTPMKISFAANLCNLVGNFLLIYPPRTLRPFGFPLPMWGAGMGVRGAALSTAISFFISAAGMAAALARRGDGLRLALRGTERIGLHRLRDLIRVGIPIAAERVVISSGQMFYVAIISGLGTVAISAHFLATTAEGVCYTPAYGIATATTTLVGQALGAGDEIRAAREGRACICFCTLMMALPSVLMYFYAVPMLQIFSRDAEVIAQGAMALRIVSFAEILFSVALTSSGALRGAGDTTFPFWMGLAGMYVVRIFFAKLFVQKMGLGLAGAWYAMDIDLIFRGVLLWARFMRGGWVAKSRALNKQTLQGN